MDNCIPEYGETWFWWYSKKLSRIPTKSGGETIASAHYIVEVKNMLVNSLTGGNDATAQWLSEVDIPIGVGH